jgi:tape measure domain-containing protein
VSTTVLDLKVLADARQAVRGLKPLSTSLTGLTKDAQKTEAALSDLDKPIKVKVNDDAINNAKKEIQRLQAEIRENLKVDINADTKTAQRRIRELQSIVRTLDSKDVKVDVKVDVDDSEMSRLRTGFGKVRAAGEGAAGGIGAGLGRLAQSSGLVLGSVIGVVAAVGIAAGAVAKNTLGLADNLDNAKIAFTQFLGSAEAADTFLRDLTALAAKTPFEFPELVGASKKLLAFGIAGDDVLTLMTTLGDAAALTGASVDDLAEIWGQMAAKGKVSNEELLQLTERGIPAYEALAEAMGKTPAEIQKMAEKGQLLAGTTLPVLQSALDEAFGGGMAKQAETLGGKLSTIQDTLKGIGTTAGQALLPFAIAAAEKLQPALDDLAAWAKDNKGTIALSITEGISAALEFGAGLIDMFGMISVAIGDVIGWVGDLTVSIGTALQALGDLPGFADDLGDGTVAAGENMKKLGQSVKDTKPTFDDWSGTLRDAAGQVRDFGSDLASGFDTENAQTELSDLQAHLEELKKKPPTIQVEAEIAAARQKIKALKEQIAGEAARKHLISIDARVSSARSKLSEINDALKNLRGKKATPEVKADIKEWKAKRKTVETEMARLKAARPAVAIKVTTTGVSQAAADIDSAARDRDATITVKTRKAAGSGGTSPDFDVNGRSIVPQLFGTDSRTLAGVRAAALAAPAMVATTAAPGGSQRAAASRGTVTELAPRQMPVKVYLDGAEIADHLTLKASRLATVSTVRRRA